MAQTARPVKCGKPLARRSKGQKVRYRQIDKEQAVIVLTILQEECGFVCTDPRQKEAFRNSILAPQPDGGPVCAEYRFMGSLGFGGKFRNNGNNNNVPYVDCYSEHETPERLKMIDAANARLAEIFPSS